MSDPQTGLQLCVNAYCNSGCKSHGFKMGGCSDSLDCCCYGCVLRRLDYIVYMFFLLLERKLFLFLLVQRPELRKIDQCGVKDAPLDSDACVRYCFHQFRPTVANPCYMYDPKGLQSCVNAYCNFQCRGYGYNSGACSDSSTCCCS